MLSIPYPASNIKFIATEMEILNCNYWKKFCITDRAYFRHLLHVITVWKTLCEEILAFSLFKNFALNLLNVPFCVCLKHKTLCSCLCHSSVSCSSASHIRDFGTVNRYFRFYKSHNTLDRGGEFSFFQGMLVRIDISISIRPMITKFGKQVYMQDLTRMRLIKQGR